ncbi:MAG: DMT family transporter [Sphingobacteriia bacterium]|nr:DMT family transporter [Sphingobacteriia bacterium]
MTKNFINRVLSSNSLKGIVLVIFSLFLYAFSDALIRLMLKGYNYGVEQTTFLRALTRIVPLILASLVFYKSFEPLKTNRPWAHLINSAIGCARTYAFMLAFKLIPLAEASALSYTSALFFVILSVIFLKEKIKNYHIAALVLGTIGVVIAYEPGANILKLGALVTLAGAFFAAVNKIIIRKLSFYDNSLGIVLYPNLFLMIVTLPFIVNNWKVVPIEHWGIFLLIGLLAALAQYSFAIALKLTKGLTLAPYDYTYFVWVILMDFLFNGEIPKQMVIIGALFIIGSNVIILMNEFRKADSDKGNKVDNKAATETA